ncbi:hypothetical protein ACFX15_038026 [Malus domestica]
MTKQGEDLVPEEDMIHEENQDTAAVFVTRFLMMSDKRLALDKIVHFTRDFALPVDFRTKWLHKYPQHFKVVKDNEAVEHLELVNWNPAWAITELEKKTMRITEASDDHVPGLLSLSSPLKFPPNYKKANTDKGAIDHFQKEAYEASAEAVWHLLCFGEGKRFSVFLKEAYKGSELIEKCPLVVWKEKVQSLIGYRGKKKIEAFSDMADNGFCESDLESEDTIELQLEQEEKVDDLEDDSLADDSEMESEEICSAYDYEDTKRQGLQGADAPTIRFVRIWYNKSRIVVGRCEV